MPSFADIRREVKSLELAGLTNRQLADKYLKKTRNKYTSVGVITSIPGTIPGVGTVAQLALETGSVSADMLLMLRWMASLCYGIGLFYGKDTEHDFEDEFSLVLGIWSGTIDLKTARETRTELSIGTFDKHISDRIRNRMSQKIWKKMAVKYGSKRGGAALGKLIPFGIGAIIGGTFNYFTIERFGKAAIDYFGPDANVATIQKP